MFKTLKKHFQGPKSGSHFVFLLLWAIILVLYYQTRNAGFTMDFTGWQEAYEQGSFWDISRSFGGKSLLPFLHLVFYSFYKLFGISGLPWYLFFTFLHALNGALAFALFKRWMDKMSMTKTAEKAFMVALVFVLIPYQVEVLVWKVTVHYLMSVGLLLGILWYATDYLESKKSLWKVFSLFLISLLTLEISFVTPATIFVLLVFWTMEFSERKRFVNRFFWLVVPLFIGLLGLIGLNQLVLGAVVGHYGTEVHMNVKPVKVVGTMYNYFAKHLFFVRFWEHPDKTKLFDFIFKPKAVALLTGGFGLSFILYLRYFKKLSAEWRLAGLGLVIFFIELLPIASLYFYYLLYGENDRYSYVASIFYALFFVLFIYRLPKWLRYPLLAMIIFFSVRMTNIGTSAWHDNAIVFNSLLDDYRWYDKKDVIILASPGNYKGTFLLRSGRGQANLHEEFLYKKGKDIKGAITVVANYNLNSLNDGVLVTQTAPDKIEVIFKDWGHWWWLGGIGLGGYSTERYYFEPIHKGYRLNLKKDFSGSTFIYHFGTTWKTFDYQPLFAVDTLERIE